VGNFGHMTTFMEWGFRIAKIQDNPLLFHAAQGVMVVIKQAYGLDNLQNDPKDLARATHIGNELTGGGDVEQTQFFNDIVGGGDPHQMRLHFDEAVKAVIERDHVAAWEHIGAIAKAGNIPTEAQAELDPNFDHRGGNTIQDLALSIYAYATGEMAAKGYFPTGGDLAAHYLRMFHEAGEDAQAINAAATPYLDWVDPRMPHMIAGPPPP
jgi:hypothetical protein